MKVLAIEPFYGGSHQAFLDGWTKNSRHEFTILSLPDKTWKWRMRHSALTLSKQLLEPQLHSSLSEVDVLWCSDMLNLPEFLGLAPSSIANLPRIVYFHENQLTYPVRQHDQRDLHFAYSNFLTCCAADAVWFNSGFHQQEFFPALRTHLQRMPSHRHVQLVDEIEARSKVMHPGIERLDPGRAIEKSEQNDNGPIRICWNARWEHDKNPDDFFAAMRLVKQSEIPFQLIVLGESFQKKPAVFEAAEQEFQSETLHWGFAASRDEYAVWLHQADVVVSTANHEFFGLAVLEAIQAGAHPCLPNRLAYPEVISELRASDNEPFLFDPVFDGTARGLVSRLIEANAKLTDLRTYRARVSSLVEPFDWSVRANQFDNELDDFLANRQA